MKALKILALALALLLALSACGVIRSGGGPTQAAGGSSPPLIRGRVSTSVLVMPERVRHTARILRSSFANRM